MSSSDNWNEYKANIYGNWVSAVDQWFASSKICSSCGNRKEQLKLSERVYRCQECGFEEDRDLNAAINIEREGVRLLA